MFFALNMRTLMPVQPVIGASDVESFIVEYPVTTLAEVFAPLAAKRSDGSSWLPNLKTVVLRCDDYESSFDWGEGMGTFEECVKLRGGKLSRLILPVEPPAGILYRMRELVDVQVGCVSKH